MTYINIVVILDEFNQKGNGGHIIFACIHKTQTTLVVQFRKNHRVNAAETLKIFIRKTTTIIIQIKNILLSNAHQHWVSNTQKIEMHFMYIPSRQMSNLKHTQQLEALWWIVLMVRFMLINTLNTSKLNVKKTVRISIPFRKMATFC